MTARRRTPIKFVCTRRLYVDCSASVRLPIYNDHARLISTFVVCPQQHSNRANHDHHSRSMPSREYLFKILVIGELATGKTSYIKRYVHQYFSKHYKATVNCDSHFLIHSTMTNRVEIKPLDWRRFRAQSDQLGSTDNCSSATLGYW
jgi:hypothetical protein